MKRALCYTVLVLLLCLSSVVAQTSIRIGGTYYNSLQEAYNAAANGASIQCKVDVCGGGITASQTKTITLAGGYNDTWTAIAGKTTVGGAIVMQAGQLVFQHCILDESAEGSEPPPPPEDTYSISGNAKVGSVTVTAGSQSAVTDANGDFIITGLEPGAYSVTPTKSDCSFTPDHWDITIVAEDWEDANFSTPCSNDFDPAEDCFATDYASDFLEGYFQKRSYTLDTYYKYPLVGASYTDMQESGIATGCWVVKNSYTPSCRPNLPLYKLAGTYALPLWGFVDCYGVWSPFLDKTEERTHTFPKYFPMADWGYQGCPSFETIFAGDPHYAVVWCGDSYFCAGLRCDALVSPCAVWVYQDRLRVVDPVAGEYPLESLHYNCTGDNFDYIPWATGPEFRNVYPHEVTPDGWGMLPGDEFDTPGIGVLLVPDGHEVPANPVIGSNVTKGNAYLDFRYVSYVFTTERDKSCLENSEGNDCGGYTSSATGDANVFLPDMTIPLVCHKINDRTIAFDYDNDGDWDEIFITGYATGGGFLQNFTDNMTAILNLRGYGSYSANVQAVIDFIYTADMNHQIDHENFWMRGHSLGGQEALLITRAVDLGLVDKLTTYGIAVNTPYDAMAPINGVYSEHFVDGTDYPLSSSAISQIYRTSAEANIYYITNLSGYFTSVHVHDRTLYQQNATTITGTPHPVR